MKPVPHYVFIWLPRPSDVANKVRHANLSEDHLRQMQRKLTQQNGKAVVHNQMEFDKGSLLGLELEHNLRALRNEPPKLPSLSYCYNPENTPQDVTSYKRNVLVCDFRNVE